MKYVVVLYDGMADYPVPALDGKTPMIISFWAVTCKPCIRELDAINDAMPDWLDEADFRVVAISTDDSRFSAQARAWVEGLNWKNGCAL